MARMRRERWGGREQSHGRERFAAATIASHPANTKRECGGQAEESVRAERDTEREERERECAYPRSLALLALTLFLLKEAAMHAARTCQAQARGCRSITSGHASHSGRRGLRVCLRVKGLFEG